MHQNSYSTGLLVLFTLYTSINAHDMSRNDSIKRQDGRAVDEIREISIAFNQLDRADGSAKFAFGASCLHSIKLGFHVRTASWSIVTDADYQALQDR